MAIVYSYPLATPESQDLLLGIEKPLVGGEEQPKTRTYTIGSIVDFVATSRTVTNTTATPFSLAALNSTYPSALIGFKVQCTNAAVLKIYEKTLTGWISYTIANVT